MSIFQDRNIDFLLDLFGEGQCQAKFGKFPYIIYFRSWIRTPAKMIALF